MSRLLAVSVIFVKAASSSYPLSSENRFTETKELGSKNFRPTLDLRDNLLGSHSLCLSGTVLSLAILVESRSGCKTVYQELNPKCYLFMNKKGTNTQILLYSSSNHKQVCLYISWDSAEAAGQHVINEHILRKFFHKRVTKKACDESLNRNSGFIQCWTACLVPMFNT